MTQKHFLWLIHFYTALGIPVAALTFYYCLKGEIKVAFFFMFLAILIDATDGPLARKFKISELLPNFDGGKLDDLVDFLNYVVVPVAMAFILRILPEDLPAIGIIPIMASAYGFSRVSAKTEDGYFTGFPSYWNLTLFYLYLFQFSIFINCAVFILLSVAVFVPIKYIVPFKTKPFAAITNTFCVVWGFNLAAIYILLPKAPTWLIVLSIFFPVYYVGIPMLQTFKKRQVV